MEKDLLNILKSRNIPDNDLHRMEENRVDKYVIPLMDDKTLMSYFPLEGDRIAIRQFCRTQKDGQARTRKKQNILQTLREKLLLKTKKQNSDSSESDSECSKPKKSHLTGNRHASKKTRKIEIGWLNHEKKSGLYKQVRRKRGGSTRKIGISKDASRGEIEKAALSLFFENGKSQLGSVDEFDFEVKDFSEESFQSTETVEEMYTRTGMNMLRFYLASKEKETNNSIITPSVSSESSNATSSFTYVLQSQSDNSLPLTETSISLQSQNSLPERLNQAIKSIIPGNTYGGMVDDDLADLHDFDTDDIVFHPVLDTSETEVFFKTQNLSSVTEDNNDTLVLSPVPVTDVSSVTENNNDTLSFSPEGVSSFEMSIHRGPLGFLELCGYFKDPAILHKLLIIKRILPNGQEEQGEDTGGVLRDLLSEFWNEFYDRCTIGRDVRVPCLRHDFGTEEWKSVARVFAYGYAKTGYWPVKIAKSFFDQCLFPENDVVKENLLEDFYNFVSVPDKDVFMQATEDFSVVDNDDLLDSLETYDCRTMVHATNVKAILLEIAHKEIVQTPMFICECWRDILKGARVTKERVADIYSTLIPSVKKVLQIIDFPEEMGDQVKEVSRHVKRYVKDLDARKLRLFLRFCTGSDLLTVQKITVEFTSMFGLQRRPVAHTCGCVLEVANQYENYMEFRTEFDNILEANVWVMDIV